MVTCKRDLLEPVVRFRPPQPKTQKHKNKHKMKLVVRIKKEFFDLVKSGQKNEEYRDCTDYWVSRLVEDVIGAGETQQEEEEEIVYKKFNTIVFMCGKETVTKQWVDTFLKVEEGLFVISFK